MSEQYAFGAMLEEMEVAEAARVNAHRTDVQAFFDALSDSQKDQLARWLSGSSDWLTYQALAAAAGDWAVCTKDDGAARKKGDVNGNLHQG